jgi:hypothetical protein
MRAIALLCAVVLLLTACSTQVPSRDSEDARASTTRFRVFPLYWVGEEFEHLPLSQFERLERPPSLAQLSLGLHAGTNDVVLIYGSCEASSDGGCATPLEITISPACTTNFSLYRFGPPGAGPPLPPVQVEGVPAVWPAGHLELYTGTITIDIYGERAVVLRAAAALRPANRLARALVRRGVHLPPPAPGHLEGRIPCP